ncbi:MAG: DUF1795 domain-containing protein [Ruminococcaceae bacterium]|nr:DUF1795 domain-containing protein [Oscillospiraceae bacterium]
MSSKIKRIAAALLLLAMLTSAFAACSNSDVPDGYQLVACEGDCFRLYVPTQWTPNTAGGVTSAYYSASAGVSVGVTVADDAGELSVEEYWNKCNENFASSLKDYEWSGKHETMVLGGKPAYKYVYTASVTVVNGEKSETLSYKFMQVMARYEDELYVFVYSAPLESYDAYLETVEGDSDGAGILPYFVFAEPYDDGEDKKYSDKVTAPEGMKLISTDELAYRFFVPTGWIVNDRAEYSAAYASDTDSSNVSVQMYMTKDESKTVEEYFAECEARYKNIFESYELLSTEDIKMDGVPAKQYTYTAVIGGVEYKQLQAIVVKGAVFYTVTYTALPEKFDTHLSDVAKMIENFDVR